MIDVAALTPSAERIAADIEELSTFTEGGEGWSRRVLSDPYRASRDWVRRRMTEAGLEVTRDGAGNLVGRLEGASPGAPALLTGSHTDTVLSGGRFDGIVGVLGAVELVRRLRETGSRFDHPLWVIDFYGEETNRHGNSCIGSRSVTGLLARSWLEAVDDTGRTLGDAMVAAGVDPDAALRAAWAPGAVHASVELHVEQGPVLEREGTEIGVVTAIAGIERILAAFVGRPDHAGTAAMTDRRDALAAAAQAVLRVEQIGCGTPDERPPEGSTATAGQLEVSPNAVNIVPGRVNVWSELRSTDQRWLQGARRHLVELVRADAQARDIELEVDWLVDQAPVPTTRSVSDEVARAADRTGHSWRAMPSGAGHDSAHLAHLGPMGMVFVPSRDGRSHCPEEFTDAAQIAAGVHVLGATLAGLDAR